MAAQEGDNQMNNCCSIGGCTISDTDSNTYLTGKQWRPGGSPAGDSEGAKGLLGGRRPAGKKFGFLIQTGYHLSFP
jgi:hypothetical protein